MTRPGLITATQCSGAPLPEPIRVSAGFCVTGLSGKTLIQTLPPRRILRVIAIRAASIWRFVTQPFSSAFSPKSPACTAVWPFAKPRRRPRWYLRSLAFLGASISGALAGALVASRSGLRRGLVHLLSRRRVGHVGDSRGGLLDLRLDHRLLAPLSGDALLVRARLLDGLSRHLLDDGSLVAGGTSHSLRAAFPLRRSAFAGRPLRTR